jgi:hypothetical protein
MVAPSAARCTTSHPFLAAALVSYPSPVATTWPLLAFSRNRNFPVDLRTPQTCPPWRPPECD